jgi:hypothetical protein
MRSEMARVEISTEQFASILAHPGEPILTRGRVLTRFAPNRALFACGRSKHAPIAIEHGDEELLQCERVEFPTAVCSRVRVKRRLPAALGNSLPAQFITYQTRNSVQSNGATSGPNVDHPVKVRVGKIEKDFVVKNIPEQTYSVTFEDVNGADTIEIIPPKPILPKEVDPNSNDTRKLGLGLFSLKIKD